MCKEYRANGEEGANWKITRGGQKKITGALPLLPHSYSPPLGVCPLSFPGPWDARSPTSRHFKLNNIYVHPTQTYASSPCIVIIISIRMISDIWFESDQKTWYIFLGKSFEQNN